MAAAVHKMHSMQCTACAMHGTQCTACAWQQEFACCALLTVHLNAVCCTLCNVCYYTQHQYAGYQGTDLAHIYQPIFFVVNNRPDSKHSHLVQKQLIGTWAVLLKRGWVDQTAEERHAAFAEVEHTVASSRDAAARRTAIQILEVGLLSLQCSLLR